MTNAAPNLPRGEAEPTIPTRLKELAARRAEEFIDEIPQTLRRLRMLLVVLSVSVPVGLGIALFILWRALS